MICSAIVPYAKEGAHCKHMAAVLYYLDSHPVYDEHVLVDALSEKQAKQLLKKILKRSSRILRSTTAGRKERRY